MSRWRLIAQERRPYVDEEMLSSVNELQFMSTDGVVTVKEETVTRGVEEVLVVGESIMHQKSIN